MRFITSRSLCSVSLFRIFFFTFEWRPSEVLTAGECPPVSDPLFRAFARFSSFWKPWFEPPAVASGPPDRALSIWLSSGGLLCGSWCRRLLTTISRLWRFRVSPTSSSFFPLLVMKLHLLLSSITHIFPIVFWFLFAVALALFLFIGPECFPPPSLDFLHELAPTCLNSFSYVQRITADFPSCWLTASLRVLADLFRLRFLPGTSPSA